MQVARYHSLIIVPGEKTNVTAWYKEIPMALEDKKKKLYGVQFHPESFLTPEGEKIIQNFFKRAGIEID